MQRVTRLAPLAALARGRAARQATADALHQQLQQQRVLPAAQHGAQAVRLRAAAVIMSSSRGTRAGVCSTLQGQPCGCSALQLSLQQGTACWPGRGSSSWVCDSRSGCILQRRLLSSSSGGSSSGGGDSTVADAAGTPSAAAARAATAAQKLQLPPALASGMVAAAQAASQGAKATARQVSRLVRLVQQTSLSQAAVMQASSLWTSHSTAVTVLAAAAATAGLYQITHAAAGLVVDMAPGAPAYCLLASAAAVLLGGLRLRSLFVVDAERVYAVAMRKLAAHAGLQEVMGAPLAGSAMRVQLVLRGSLFVQETLLPKRRAPRIHMLFPLLGPRRSGVVSLEAKKTASGKYAFRSLMVELPGRSLAGANGVAAAAAAAERAGSSVLQAASATAPARGGSSSAASASASSSSSGVPVTPSAATAAGGSGIDADAPARIYLIGGPKAAGAAESSTSPSAAAAAAVGRTRPPTAQLLLEQLKQPLCFALQQNVVVYETQDELEAELGYNSNPEADPEQRTAWDVAKQGAASAASWGARAGCRVLRTARQALAAAAGRARSMRAAAASGGARQGPQQAAPAAPAAAEEGAAAGTPLVPTPARPAAGSAVAAAVAPQSSSSSDSSKPSGL